MSRVIGLKTYPVNIVRNVVNDLKNNLQDKTSDGENFQYDFGWGTSYEGMNGPREMDGWPPRIAEYIHRCVALSIKTILEELITDDDFHKDLGLK